METEPSPYGVKAWHTTALHSLAERACFASTKREHDFGTKWVQLLLDHGADSEAVDSEGKTPLDLANVDVTRLLLPYHPTISSALKNGVPELHAVAAIDDRRLARYIFECLFYDHTYDVNQKDSKGRTALHVAVENNHLWMAERFSELKHHEEYGYAAVEIKDNKGRTPLLITESIDIINFS